MTRSPNGVQLAIHREYRVMVPGGEWLHTQGLFAHGMPTRGGRFSLQGSTGFWAVPVRPQQLRCTSPSEVEQRSVKPKVARQALHL